ncbi:MAG TPA: phosphoadenylyl-sulfate reductase [Terriglobales bacterium]|nr:phosphoadenylyl-sulfate reductase [Terriglobales bacterium]
MPTAAAQLDAATGTPANPVMIQEDQQSQVLLSADSWTAEQVLHWAFTTYEKTKVAVASAFGAEGIVTIDVAAQVCPDFAVFTIDTGYLFPETLALIEKVEQRYGIHVQRITSTIPLKAQLEPYAPDLWSRDPDLCCRLRKIEPLKQKLAELRAWITAIRRDQTPARQHASKIEWDSAFQLTKINPLADWTTEMVWNYIRKHRLDYNPMHDRGYPSIGCTHCTRPVRIGEELRAGRWSGFAKTECGMHDRHG